MDKRMLSLLLLAHASDVLENAFAPLNDDDYELAMKRVRELIDLDLEVEAMKSTNHEIIWAVFAAFTKWVVSNYILFKNINITQICSAMSSHLCLTIFKYIFYTYNF